MGRFRRNFSAMSTLMSCQPRHRETRRLFARCCNSSESLATNSSGHMGMNHRGRAHGDRQPWDTNRRRCRSNESVSPNGNRFALSVSWDAAKAVFAALFENHGDGLNQAHPGFVLRSALPVCAWDLRAIRDHPVAARSKIAVNSLCIGRDLVSTLPSSGARCLTAAAPDSTARCYRDSRCRR